MKRFVLSAAVWAALAGSAFAQGGAAGMTLEEVAAVFKENGFAAEVDDTVIYSSTNGFNFALSAYNCTGAETRCNEFLFGASFEPPAAVELLAINKFNESTLAGRAFLDPFGEPNLEHLFTVSNGDDAELVERNLAIWDSILLEFAKQIGYYAGA